MDLDIVYIVYGYDKDFENGKKTLYVGKNARNAFSLCSLTDRIDEIVIEIYQDGHLLKTFYENAKLAIMARE